GKLDYAIRHNYSPLLSDVTVKETYIYGAIGGRVSAKKIEASTGQTFNEDSFEYNDLGESTGTPYPQCAGCATSVGPTRNVASSFTNGFLTRVNGYTSASALISYWPNGMYHTMTHLRADGVDGPTIAQMIDITTGMSRPLSIAVTQACDTFSITSQPADRTITSGSQAGLTVASPGATSFQWYQITGASSVLV